MRRASILFFLLIPFMLHGQGRNGPRIGMSMATITSSGFQWNGLPKLGPIIGWSFEIPWTRQASFLLEPMYIGKGSVTQNAQQQTWTRVRLGYIELPLMFKISTDTMPGGIFLTGGLLGGYLLNGRQVVKQDGDVTYDQKYDLSGSTSRKQVSLAFGMGAEKKNFSFEVRVQTSITPFSPVVKGQNLVAGLHFTWYLPKKEPKKKKDEDEEPEEE